MKNINENVINKMKKIVKDKQAMKIDGVLVDLYTASAVTQIYDKVNPANKKKMEKMSPQGLATAAFKILGKKESVSEDASGMNPKQKMKFDQLMKKLDGGKEHMKFKRMAKTPVQGDDMFHGYVKDLAMKESVKISFHSKGAKTKWMKKQGVASKEIINQTPTSVELPPRWKDLSKKKDHDEIFSVVMEYTTVSPKMAKVFDSLKVGDKIAYKTKRYSSDGHKVTKKEMLRHNQAGIERITLGKGVYLLKNEKTKEVMMKSGNMPVTIIDLVKESLNEAPKPFGRVGQPIPKPSQVRSAISRVKKQLMKKYKQKGGYENFGQKELAKMKTQFNYNPSGEPDEREIAKMLRAFDDWAMDYDGDMREGIIEKAMTLGGTNAPSGETYMGDKGIQKMVALSKKNPNIEYTVKSDNFGDFKAHWLKNGKFAKRTVANINFDMDKNAVRGVPKGKTVKSTIFVLRYSVNEGVQMENDEYDNEGGMALQQLKVAKDAAMELCDIIKKDDNLPEWVQSKLTKAVDYMDSVRDYMSSKEGEEPVNEKVVSELAPLVGLAARGAANFAAKKGVGKVGQKVAGKTAAIGTQTAIDKTKSKITSSESMARARADARRDMGGRGAQKGMAPLKKDVDNDATDGDRKAASKHIIQQLRKAADLPNGAEVEFKNGKGKVDRNSAQMVLKKYLAMKKPMDKEKFQANIKSLSDVKKILGR